VKKSAKKTNRKPTPKPRKRPFMKREVVELVRNEARIRGVSMIEAMEDMILQKSKCTLTMNLSIQAKCALTYFNNEYWGGKSGLENVAAYILEMALARAKAVDGWLSGMSSYCAAEDIRSQRGFIAGQIAANEEYRRAYNRTEDQL
jgi:hypothetical protein